MKKKYPNTKKATLKKKNESALGKITYYPKDFLQPFARKIFLNTSSPAYNAPQNLDSVLR